MLRSSIGRGRARPGVLVGCLLLLGPVLGAGGPALAAGRFSITAQVGGVNGRDEVRSEAANVLTILDERGNEDDRFIDPRLDSSAANRLKIDPGAAASLSLRFELTPVFSLEARAGRHETTVGDIEVSPLFGSGFGSPEPTQVVLIEAGDLTRVPLHLGGKALLRRGKRVRPYLAAGLGYALSSFEPSPDLERISLHLDEAVGRDARLTSEADGQTISIIGQSERPLAGARIEAPDSFEWYVGSGFEIGFGERWALVTDVRLTASRRGLSIGFDGGTSLGAGVPQATVPVGSPLTEMRYGPVQVTQGGVDFDGDGDRDGGFLYIQGGEIGYDTVSLELGARRRF